MSAKKITIAAVGAVALLAAGGAVSAATVGASSSAPPAGSTSDGLAVCVTRATGAVRAAVSPCTKQEYRMVLGRTGDRGPRGAQGERGLRGAQGERGERGPSDLYWNEFTVDGQGYGLPIPGSPTAVNVASVVVPAGSYLFGFTATIENSGGQQESIQCGTADGVITPMNVDVPAGVARMRYVLNQPLTVPADGWIVTVTCQNPFGGDGDLKLYYGTVTMLRLGSSTRSVPS